MNIYRLKISIEDITPLIWRQIEVPDSYTLYQLHEVIQRSMGWEDSHLHLFTIRAQEYTTPYDDEEDMIEEYGQLDDREYTLLEVLGTQTKKISYMYDFGDGWIHEIVVEARNAPDKNGTYPICLSGERACPPEDCGGVHGYYGALEALKNPRGKKHKHLLEWLGDYDPEKWDIKIVNKSLATLGKSYK